MSIDLLALNRIICEEDVIAAFIRTRRHSNDELRRTLSLFSKTGYNQNSQRLLNDIIWSLKQSFRDLDESLKIHYSHELNVYSTTLNAARITALKLDHKATILQMDKIRLILDSVTDRNIRRKCTGIYQEIDVFCCLLEAHNKREKARHLLLKKFDAAGQV